MRFTDAEANAYLDARSPQFNSGYIRLYDGIRQATADTALGGGNHLLSTLRFGSTAFASASSRSITANAITGDSSAATTGFPAFARIFKSDGITVVGDASVGISGSGAEMIISTPTGTGQIVATGPVTCSLFVLSFPVG